MTIFMKSSLPMQSGIIIVIIWSLLLGSLVPPDAPRNDPSVAINRLETYLWKHLLLIPSLIETEYSLKRETLRWKRVEI